jgi:hypothetical protein
LEDFKVFKVEVFDENEISIYAENQCWSADDCKNLLKYDIVYERGCAAVWVEKRKNLEPLIHIMGEDDGHLFWRKKNDESFSFCWFDDYLSVLSKAKDYVSKHNKKFNIKG